MADFRASVGTARKKLVADTAARHNRLVAHRVLDLDMFRALAVLCHPLRAPRTLLVVLVAVVDLWPVSAFRGPLALVQAYGELGSAPHRSGDDGLAAMAHEVLGRGLQTGPTGAQMAGHLAVVFAAREQLAALSRAHVHRLDRHLVGRGARVDRILPDSLESVPLAHSSHRLVLAADFHASVATAAHQSLALVVARGNVALLRQFTSHRELSVVATTLGVHHRVARRTLSFVARPVARVATVQLLAANLAAGRHWVQAGRSWRSELVQSMLSAWTVAQQAWRTRTLVAVGRLRMTRFGAPVVPAVQQVVADLVALETARPLGSCRERTQGSTLMALERSSVFSAVAPAGDGFFAGTAQTGVAVPAAPVQIARHQVVAGPGARPPRLVGSQHAGELPLGSSTAALHHGPHGRALLDMWSRVARKRAAVDAVGQRRVAGLATGMGLELVFRRVEHLATPARVLFRELEMGVVARRTSPGTVFRGG
ncbi:hypothetical protein KL933_004415 [Ogataea haglerorum]|uniref:Uncharacterized protein n=1 Tax=Ogataea haglerorum TaxID=1937702 RepID=A0AAN6D3J2_9ASCO|nr:hypothetical protein KL933_004415 [Ogataea haglerorum]